MNETSAPVLNGNQFCKHPHVFIKGKGCYVQSRELAVTLGTSPKGVGLWVEDIQFQGQTWYRAGNLNVWD